MLNEFKGLTYPQGFRVAVAEAGIKQKGLDMLLLVADEKALTCGMFTTNAMKAAPVLWDQKILGTKGCGKAQAILVNSGNANAATGTKGLDDVKTLCSQVAKDLKIKAGDVLMCSTGIIGQRLPMNKLSLGVGTLLRGLQAQDQGSERAIMTTDTRPKCHSVSVMLGKTEVRLSGIAKGAGMIHPNMATMLSFLTTDVCIKPAVLNNIFRRCVEKSYHAITIDGDQSTNDTVLLLASGKAGNVMIDSDGSKAAKTFEAALLALTQELAKDIVRDGEGITKFIQIAVSGGRSEQEARAVGMAIARSSLVKTAMFGQDANWGRILAAAGSCGDFDPAKISLSMQGLPLFAKNKLLLEDKSVLKAKMTQPEVFVELHLQQGRARATVWTCDLSYEYVKINAEYHT